MLVIMFIAFSFALVTFAALPSPLLQPACKGTKNIAHTQVFA